MELMTSDIFYNIIQQRLADKQPTSVCRAGDGECIILNGYNDRPKFEWVLNRQLGYVPGDALAIRGNLITAYNDADFIGLPSNPREGLNSYWYRVNEMVEMHTDHKAEIISNDFHNEWLTDGVFDKLLKGLDTLCYISCRNLDSQLSLRYGIKNIYSYTIAPEMKFTPDYIGKPHWPDQFNEVQRWMDTILVAGNLCLVGAGVVGKIYNAWFKQRGGISLDIGNCFDAWAGLKTRGEGKGAGVIDETYKI